MKEVSSYSKQKKLTVTQFITEVPNLIMVFLSALLTGSLITWLDFIDSFGGVLGEGIVMAQSKKLSRDLKYEYNYGIGKLEALTTILCEGISIGGLICIIVVSIFQIVSPVEPSALIIYVVILKVINVLFDLWFVIWQKKIKKESKSRIIENEYISNLSSLAFDVASLISLLVVWIFRKSQISWYVAPALSLIIAIIFILFCVKHIKNAIYELSDKTLPEAIQLKILKVLVKYQEKYEFFDKVNSHYNGSKLIIDIDISFYEDTTFKEIESFHKLIEKELTEALGDCVVSLILS